MGDFQMLRLALHEMRTPLTSVKLNAQMLERLLVKQGLAKECGFVATIVSATRRLDELTQELAEVAHLRSGKAALHRRVEDLARLLPELLSHQAGTLDTSRIRVSLPADSLPILVDVRSLDRILRYLLPIGLAWDTRRGGMNLRIFASDDEIQFSLDAPADSPHGAAEVPGDEELGLGFCLARALVECHGGMIDVLRGSTGGLSWRFSLPRGLASPGGT
jgi:K+-sensing histidine kinase KdpD